MWLYSEMHPQRLDNDLWDSGLPGPLLPGGVPVHLQGEEYLSVRSRPWLTKRHDYSPAVAVARYAEEPESLCQPGCRNDYTPEPAANLMAQRVECSHNTLAHGYTCARAPDSCLRPVARSTSRDDTGNFYRCCLERVEYRNAGRLVRGEVESALCRMGIAHARFSGNPRSAQETAHPEIAALQPTSSFVLSF